MEDVIDVYTRLYDPLHPVVCFDESNKQLVGETVEPLPLQPGQPQRYDYQYERNGVCNLFMFSEPLAGWRHVEVTERRTKQDYAQHLLHNICAFEPAVAKRILDKLEFHYTPKHGSWLNMAEIELSVLSRQCLNRRIPDKESLQREVAAWSQRRNLEYRKIDWQFTTSDARIKLKRLYPLIQSC